MGDHSQPGIGRVFVLWLPTSCSCWVIGLGTAANEPNSAGGQPHLQGVPELFVHLPAQMRNVPAVPVPVTLDREIVGTCDSALNTGCLASTTTDLSVAAVTPRRFDLYPSVREPLPASLPASLIRWSAHLWELLSALSQSSPCLSVSSRHLLPLSPSLHTTSSIPIPAPSLGSYPVVPPIPFSRNISATSY